MERGAATGRALPVKISHVVKRYGSVRAIDDVSLSVSAGEFVTLLGPSGSGKTSLLMTIAGFARPEAGSIKVGENEIVRLPPHKRDIGMVFQNYALFPHMNVGENIAYPLRLRGVGKTEVAEKVARTLDLVQLSGYAERRVDALSGGQRQRVALARAIAFEPGILLMDEPLSALDKQLRERMQVEIRRLHDRLGTTTIAVTHDQREALTMSDRVAVLHQGRLMQFDTPRQLYERPCSRFVAEFIGESNFVPVSVTGGVARYGDLALQLAEIPSNTVNQLLLLRPEKLVPLNGTIPGGINRLVGIVVDAIFQGDSLLLSVRLSGGHEISARLPNRRFGEHGIPAPGSSIEFGLAPEDTLLVAEA
ncbi:MAG: ABC transporter ATP-binding protein [Rhodospirillaceae bacterium]|nr:ABC transporter ATP-binding protein [Rhodospirillaceae bacterium]